ncbi:MAG: GDSL-type esterase/lipase family protein [Pleurocapsa sp. MO_192.B19]|nr:GDSL-type esterase/lipase family protein [Pleurocapsa sp. MO_192.B19]
MGTPHIFFDMDINSSEILTEIRIMPLGDSITQGDNERNTYRRPLWQKLQEADFNTVDFVGSQTENSNGPNPNPDFDLDHEGHSGFRTDEILLQLDDWVDSAQPDVALIHLGTNDILQGQSADSTIDELSQVIDTFRANNPNITIFLAQIIPTINNNDELQVLNEQISVLAAEKDQENSPVIVVDQFSGFNLSDDTYDSIHPNSNGENKIADRWLASFSELFTESNLVDSDLEKTSSSDEDFLFNEEVQRGDTVYRFFNPTSGVHLYTANPSEYNSLIDEPTNFTFEAESYVSVDPLSGGREVSRFRNTATDAYFYTISQAEKDFITNNLDNYVLEDSEFNAFDTEVEGTIPIYRFYEPTIGTHFFTENIDEKMFVENNLSYDFEGIAYYAYST